MKKDLNHGKSFCTCGAVVRHTERDWVHETLKHFRFRYSLTPQLHCT